MVRYYWKENWDKQNAYIVNSRTNTLKYFSATILISRRGKMELKIVKLIH